MHALFLEKKSIDKFETGHKTWTFKVGVQYPLKASKFCFSVYFCPIWPSISGVATGVARGADCHPWQRKICQKSGKIGEKEEKSGRKGKNREGSFTLPLLTDRSGYATAFHAPCREPYDLAWFHIFDVTPQSILHVSSILHSYSIECTFTACSVSLLFPNKVTIWSPISLLVKSRFSGKLLYFCHKNLEGRKDWSKLSRGVGHASATFEFSPNFS